MQSERRIPRIITGVALVGALAVLLGVALVQTLGWYRFVPVLSGSMSPFIETGDLAVLQPVDATDLVVGDVIAFEAPIGDRPLMLHRVSQIVSPAPELRFRTQGDANASDDPWTASVADDVLWRATDRIPSLGQPVVFAHRVGTPTLVMLAGGLVFFALVLRRLWIIEPTDADRPAGPYGPYGPYGYRTDELEERRLSGHPRALQPSESIVTMVVVAAVVIAAAGLIFAGPAQATFTAVAGEEQRVTFRSTTPPAQIPPPTALRAEIVCDVVGSPTGVTLQWTSPAEAVDSITIERSSTPVLGEAEPYVLLARVRGTDTDFKDDFATVDPAPTNPLDVRYRVQSVMSDGTTSVYSNVADVEPCIPELSVEPPTTTGLPVVGL